MKAIEAMRVKAVGQEGAKVEDGILVTERISTNASFHFPSIVNKGIRSPKAQELTSLQVLYEAMENMFVEIFAAFQYTHLTIICFLQLSSFKCTF